MNQPANNRGTATPEIAPDEHATHEANDDVHLGKAAEEELKRLAAHPVEEVERLRDEVREGRTASGLFLLVGGIAASMWFLAAALIAAVFLVAYFVAR
jgi:dolichol kinase